MASFLSIVALVVCLSATALAEVENNPKSVIDTFWLVLTETSPSATCTSTCPTTCAAQSAACIDVPDVMDCANLDTQCYAACDDMCACFKGCTSKCIAKESCVDVAPEEVISCNLRHHFCVTNCNSHCPVDGMTEEFEALLAGSENQMANIQKMLTGMMAGGAP